MANRFLTTVVTPGTAGTFLVDGTTFGFPANSIRFDCVRISTLSTPADHLFIKGSSSANWAEITADVNAGSFELNFDIESFYLKTTTGAITVCILVHARDLSGFVNNTGGL
jgi:hypothetical protein